MPSAWQDQLKEFVNMIDRLKNFIRLTPDEEQILNTTQTTWGTTPYFASLMAPDDPDCPIRKQVIPSRLEQQNRSGMKDFQVWKENRATEDVRPDSIARQYKDRVDDKLILKQRHARRGAEESYRILVHQLPEQGGWLDDLPEVST